MSESKHYSKNRLSGVQIYPSSLIVQRRTEPGKPYPESSPLHSATAASLSDAAEEEEPFAMLHGVFALLYPEVSCEHGMSASRNERLSKGYGSVSLTYGEVSAKGVSDNMRQTFLHGKKNC